MCCCEDMQGSSALCQAWHLGEQLLGCVPCWLLLGLPQEHWGEAAAPSTLAELSPVQAEMAILGLRAPRGAAGAVLSACARQSPSPGPGSVCSSHGMQH